MGSKITDVIIHTKETLDDSRFHEVANRVRTGDGVVSVGRNDRHPNFLMVAYNAGRTRSTRILESVTGLGINASLVGI